MASEIKIRDLLTFHLTTIIERNWRIPSDKA